jgi:DNA-binding response OmpR family regulator
MVVSFVGEPKRGGTRARIGMPPATLILLDDDALVANALWRILNNAGYAVEVAPTTADALRQIELTPPRAVIINWQKPLVDSLGFLYRLRSRDAHQHMPVLIIALGAPATAEMVAELSSLNATLRQKPIPATQLVSDVRALVGRAGPPDR